MRSAPIEVASLDGGSTVLSAAALRALSEQLAGTTIGAGDAGWHESIRLWNGMAARTPALVIEPSSAMDVAAVVRFASRHRLLLSIKSGGHHIAGTAIADHCLVLDMARLREITVDASARLATVGAGCRLQDVDAATQKHGLATVLGFVSEVGVAGLTLGGGLGYLTRRFGWTVDNLEAVEIVTADGEIRTASRSENSDLFWALRGGGGNFGVVTRFVFRLHEVGPDVFGGLIAWPFERADEILDAYRTITSTAPPELAVWLVLLRGPAAPFVPQEWHGKRLCALCICYTGDLARVDNVLAPVRALGAAVVDLLQVQPYTQVQSYLDATEPKGMHYYWKTEYLAELSASCLSILLRVSPSARFPMQTSACCTSAARSMRAQRTTARLAIAPRASFAASKACGHPTSPMRKLSAMGTRRVAAAAPLLDRRHVHQLSDAGRRREPDSRNVRIEPVAPAEREAALRSAQSVSRQPQYPPAAVARSRFRTGGHERRNGTVPASQATWGWP